MEQFLTHYGIIGIFLGAAFEGQTAVVVGGLLARQHMLPLVPVLASATAGSGIIDHLLFVAGRRYREHPWVLRTVRQVAFARALRFIERYPVGYILAFRFIFGLRMASPVAIGVSAVPGWRFTALNIVGALIWATSFTALGYIFGETVHSLFGRHAGRWTVVLVGALVAAVALFGLARYVRGRMRR